MFAKLFQILNKVLSKINVFYQILFIIVMMIIFMAILSLTGNRALNSIQQNTQKIYTNTAEMGGVDTSNIEIEVEKVRSYYLTLLADESTAGTTLKIDIDVLFNTVKALKDIDESSINRLEKIFPRIKSVMSEPASSENFALLSQAINDLQSVVKYLRNSTSSKNYSLFLDSESFAAKLKNINKIIMITSAVVATLIGLLIAAFISIPLKKMVERVRLLETGNLSSKTTADIGSREVNQAVKGLNKAIFGLRSLVMDISEKSLILNNASTELSSVSMDSGRSAAEVARAAEELATASSEQSRQITEAVDSIQQLSEIVTQVTQESQRIASSSSQVAQSAELGQKVTNDVAVEMNALFNSTKEAADVINVLIKTSEEISGITAIIEGIAEQTSLLALNASIEAARAGEHGKGFAIVAKETAKLAEQSKQSTRSISELIIEMKLHTNRAVETMQHGITRAEAGKNLAERATITFQEIYKALMNTVAQIDLIVESTKQMTANNDKATEAVSAIAAISEQNLASTQEVSAVAEEQSAAVQQVTALADNLRQIAGSLKQAVGVFELE